MYKWFKIVSLLFAVAVSSIISRNYAYAGNHYDFELNGFYYKVQSLESRTCSIVFWDRESVGINTGKLIIPESIIFKDRTFAVIGIGDPNYGTHPVDHPTPSVAHEIQFIRYIEVPKSIRWIGSNSFISYKNVDKVYLKGGGNVLAYAFSCVETKTIIIGTGVTSVHESSFFCSSPNITYCIEDSDTPLTVNCWSDLHRNNITQLYIGRNINLLHVHDDYYFLNSKDIIRLEIGPKVTVLPPLSECRLEELVSYAVKAPKLSAKFSSYTKYNCMVTLPTGATGYKESIGWSEIL